MSAPQTQARCLNARTLKIEADGDAWKKKIKPKIRLKGRWLEQAGFPPGQHVRVTLAAPGEMLMRIIHNNASAEVNA